MVRPSVLSRELTPSQHAFIRQQLALIPLFIWAVYAWSIFFAQLPSIASPGDSYVVRDFVHFYVQGVIARDHDAGALYDIDAMATVVNRVIPSPIDTAFPPVYGPQVALLFRPLAQLPYLPAMFVWLALTIIGYCVCVYLIWRTCVSMRRLRWATAVFALGAPGFHFTLSYGQVSLIGLICFTALWLALRRGDLMVAGIAVGALAYKPQLGIAAAVVFVLARERRVVLGAFVAVAAQLAAGVLYWGPDILSDYFRALWKVPAVIDAMEPDKAMMHSLRSFFLNLGLSSSAALTLTVIASLVTLAVALRCWTMPREVAPRFAVLVLATLLVDPHLFAYDLLILTPALMVVWAWVDGHVDLPQTDLAPSWIPGPLGRVPTRSVAKGLVLFVYCAPILTLAFPSIPVQWSVVGFVLLGGFLARHLLDNREGYAASRANQECPQSEDFRRML
jgi:alpha-1,2-mannosyltransferase